MATPTNILPANGYFIAQESTSSGITPYANASIAIVVAAPMTGEVGVEDIVMYRNTQVVGFTQSGESYQVIPLENILLTYTDAPS